MYPYIDWSKEPDVAELNLAYSALNSDPKRATARLEKLYERGSIAAAWYLADAYAVGRNLPKDLHEAERIFTDLEARSWRPASYMLGRVLYQVGDYEAAYRSFSRGAADHYFPAMYRLAMMCIEGVSCKKDIFTAEKLLAEASKGGHLFAKRDLATVYIKGKYGLNKIPIGIFMLLCLTMEMFIIIVSGEWRKEHFDDRTLA